jgi:hypothetical protein
MKIVSSMASVEEESAPVVAQDQHIQQEEHHSLDAKGYLVKVPFFQQSRPKLDEEGADVAVNQKYREFFWG